jgi:NADH-quinone oxidoreductase subunit N
MGDIKISHFSVLGPELYLCGWSLFLLLYGVYRIKRHSDNFLIFSGILVLLITAWLVTGTYGPRIILMNGMFITDRFASLVKCMIMGAGTMVMLLASNWLKEENGRPFEFVILMLFSILGMMFMVSANDLLTMYMALEMSSLGLYVLAAFMRDHAKSSEAGLKYFVLGALSSGMMLFGMSLIYGFTGTTSFDALAKLFALQGVLSKGVVVGLILVIVGLCFKISAVPFHMWTPDVYEGAPTPVTMFFATAPKIAALALFSRVMLQPFGDLVEQWAQILVFVSIATMVVGSLAAIMQTNIKRLLAYSSIGHAGFMLMGIACGNSAGIQAVLIYLALYIFMSAGAFGCVLLMRRNGHYVENIKDLAGLGRTQPLLAMVLSLFMFSMAGIPPLAGFFGKMYIIIAAIGAGLTWMAVIAVIVSVISGYYYIKVVKIMYFDEPAQPLDHYAPFLVHTGIGISALVTLLFFLYPSPLILEAKAAAEALLQ